MAEVMEWGIEPLTFRLGVSFRKNVRHSNYSATDDVSYYLAVLGSIELTQFI